MAKKKTKFNVFRLIIQWIILVLLAYMVGRLWVDESYIADFEAYCPFGGIQAFGSYIINGTLACSMTSVQIMMGLAMLVAIIIFSKLFCSYICPIGTITEWLGKIGDKLKIRITITGFMDRILRILKYALLFITLYFTFSASELFCREYDPFYAIFTGYGHSVNFWYATIAIAITIIGSIVFRQFWCKYLCPLAAVSNIFTFIILLVLVIGIYLILVISGLEISWVWPVAILCGLGFLVEAFRMKGFVIPFFRITRNDKTCTNCKLCDKACPQDITISGGNKKINHIDCNLCGNCTIVCPHKDTLNINKRNIRWFPAIVTVALVVAGLFLGSSLELATVDQRWGSEEEMAKAEVLELSGVKNIKCFGSSMGFVSQMNQVDGVLGAATYVSTRSVKVFFDPEITTREEIISNIFEPVRNVFDRTENIPQKLTTVKLGIEKFFDVYDSYYLLTLLEQNKAVFAIETEYGEPVLAKIYYDAGAIQPDGIKKVIESESVTFVSRGKEITEELSFKVSFVEDEKGEADYMELKKSFFEAYEEIYYALETLDTTNIVTYEISMPQSGDPNLIHWLPYLSSHMSADTAVVSFETKYTTEPIALIRFDTTALSEDDLFNRIAGDSLRIMYSDGEIEKMVNPFTFNTKGKILIYEVDSLVTDTANILSTSQTLEQ